MFETSFVRPGVVAAPGRAGIFGVSLMIHTAAIVGVIAVGIRSVGFPEQPPDAYAVVFTPAEVALPPAVGTPELVRRDPAPPAEPSSDTPRVTAPRDAVPVVIPDTAAPLDPATVSGDGAGASDVPGGSGAMGRPFGVPSGVGSGEGTGGIPLDGTLPFQPGGEVRPAQVLERVRPDYPAIALRNGISGRVTIRCIIGRDGQIRDPEVIASTFTAFDQAAIDAVRKWRFAPGTLRGKPVDTWFELTVRFEAVR
ncbi:MAG TPA: TonB family protein [Thermoanaerobaculia bacterium]|nr:TonB family protein [Thermoanaerobaculia bacterium]